jgi:hypothetical protein
MLARFVRYVEEYIVFKLANNKTFQRFAVKVDDTLQSKQSYINTVKETVTSKTKSNGWNPADMFKKFSEEVKKEMSAIKNQPPQQPRK